MVGGWEGAGPLFKIIGKGGARPPTPSPPHSCSYTPEVQWPIVVRHLVCIITTVLCLILPNVRLINK